MLEKASQGIPWDFEASQGTPHHRCPAPQRVAGPLSIRKLVYKEKIVNRLYTIFLSLMTMGLFQFNFSTHLDHLLNLDLIRVSPKCILTSFPIIHGINFAYLAVLTDMGRIDRLRLPPLCFLYYYVRKNNHTFLSSDHNLLCNGLRWNMG